LKRLSNQERLTEDERRWTRFRAEFVVVVVVVAQQRTKVSDAGFRIREDGERPDGNRMPLNECEAPKPTMRSRKEALVDEKKGKCGIGIEIEIEIALVVQRVA